MNKTVDKIRKLVAQANDKGVTEQEAQAFMAKANQMLLKHNLSMKDVKADDTLTVTHTDGIEYGKMYIEGNAWERSLLGVIAKANLCETIIHPVQKEMKIIGRPDNVDVCIYTYEVARALFREWSRNRYNEHKQEVLNQHDTGKYKRVELAKMLEQQKLLTYRTTFIQGYLKGAVSGLHSKFELERMEAEANDRVDLAQREKNGEDISTIVPLRTQLQVLRDTCQKEREEYIDENFEINGTMKSARASSAQDAMRQGYEDGKQASFAKGVTDAGNQQKQIQA